MTKQLTTCTMYMALQVKILQYPSWSVKTVSHQVPGMTGYTQCSVTPCKLLEHTCTH